MSRAIYLVQEGGNPVEMLERGYESEAQLQQLLADHPNVLAGDNIGGEERRWLLVARELGVPECGGDRLALDHLFLDHDAVPTLVEVKRASDRRIRREVVGQMLDYAANGVDYWPTGTFRQAFETACKREGVDPNDKVNDFLGGPEADQAEFWQKAEENLANGKVRLTFIADEIPLELQTVVEFLNKQMNRVEVLAVEIRRYVSGGHTTLVPRLVGRTAESMRRKGRTRQPADEASVFRALEDRHPAAAEAARSLLRFADDTDLETEWVSRSWAGGFRVLAVRRNARASLFSVYANCECFITFGENESSLATIAPGLAGRSQEALERKLGTAVRNRSEAERKRRLIEGWCRVRLDEQPDETVDIIQDAVRQFLSELSAAGVPRGESQVA